LHQCHNKIVSVARNLKSVDRRFLVHTIAPENKEIHLTYGATLPEASLSYRQHAALVFSGPNPEQRFSQNIVIFSTQKRRTDNTPPRPGHADAIARAGLFRFIRGDSQQHLRAIRGMGMFHTRELGAAKTGRNGKRRVAVLLGHPNEVGGTQRVAANLVRDLADAYQTVLLNVHPLPEKPIFHESGLDFRSLNYTRTPKRGWKELAEWLRIGRRLRKFVLENRIEAVLAIWSDMAIISAYALPRQVVKIGCEHIHFWEPNRKLRKRRKRAYARLDAVASLTEADAALYRKIARRVAVIPNAVPQQRPTEFEAREKILLTVGHLVPRKGIDRLLWALKEPLLQNPDWKLVCVGGGERAQIDRGFTQYVAALIKLLNLDGRVEFLPTTSAINEAYRRASIYVMGSHLEGLPMTLLEAKSFGVPCISFDCPTGPREIIRNGVDGYLIDNDTLQFAEAAGSLMKDKVKLRAFGEAALDDVRTRYSVRQVCSHWSELIEELASRK
jgi:amylovoran biosynthesis glycosyltransferase AmsD